MPDYLQRLIDEYYSACDAAGVDEFTEEMEIEHRYELAEMARKARVTPSGIEE